jgi:cell fate regulator YaaT (PSP1 superfamily)
MTARDRDVGGTMVGAVTFTKHGRLVYVDPSGQSPEVGDRVMVETVEGPEVATVVWGAQWADDVEGHLPRLLGPATERDEARDATSRRARALTKVAARRLVRHHGLPMKVVAVDHLPDACADGQVTIWFSSPVRVDFRQLVRDLGATLGMKVELRQISDRDVARVTGGIGPCGRDLCCATFLTNLEPVTLRMATDQDLPANPLRISGACGKLMCCLRYEHPLYQDGKPTCATGCSSREAHDAVG